MNSQNISLPNVYLKPGGLYFGKNPAVVSTVLGSCITVTMYHQRLRIGAICHGILPRGGCGEGFKYINCAIHHMIQKYDAYRVRRRFIEVKLFGGSDMFGTENTRMRHKPIGLQNIETAVKIIEKEGLRVMDSDLGGDLGRKIFFNTQTGEVLLKHLDNRELKGRLTQNNPSGKKMFS